ncbi:MAG: lipid-A-disaccharide synthase [Bacteroidales bacterium]|jgi:lipid-A-disaccharide synthase|nr:lipid-A-disaccharide synthase [Bacteroidales bacterium]
MRYYIIAGEASGDLHGSNLIKGLKAKDPQGQFRAWGGDLMQNAGATIVKHYKDTAIMGFVEVLMHLRKIETNLKECRKDIISYSPDIVILIDYPGFNFKIAEFAKKHGFKVFYYISPKVWAWKEGRIKLIRKYVDKLFIIFPFEIEYFKKKGITAIYNGNPLVDSITSFPHSEEDRKTFCTRTGNMLVPAKKIIALLAGSRKSEIAFTLPILLNVAETLENYQFVIACAPSISSGFYYRTITKAGYALLPSAQYPTKKETEEQGSKKGLRILSNVYMISDETYSIMSHSDAAIINSGTASLEAALLEVPQVVCYGGNPISIMIARMVVKIKYISLANLIADKHIFKELIQKECTPDNITKELDLLLNDTEYRSSMIKDYKEVKKLLGAPGASERVAASMMRELKKYSK